MQGMWQMEHSGRSEWLMRAFCVRSACVPCAFHRAFHQLRPTNQSEVVRSMVAEIECCDWLVERKSTFRPGLLLLAPANLVRTMSCNTNRISIDFSNPIPKSALATYPTAMTCRKWTILFIPAKIVTVDIVSSGPCTTLIVSASTWIAGSRRAMKEGRHLRMTATKMVNVTIAHCS